MALTEITSKGIKNADIINEDIADDTIAEAKLDISNAPSDGKFLQYKDSSDKLTWADVDTTTIPVADESSDTTCFPVFTTAATGDQAPKTGDNLLFNSSTGTFQATHLSTIASGGKITAYGAAVGSGITEACSLSATGVNISATASGACDIRFGGTTVNDYVAFKSDGAFSGTTTFILPDGDGSADQVLKTDGSGNLDWTDAGSGATGGGTEKIFWENGTTIDTDYTVGTSFGAACNAMSAGPITINTGKTVTVDAGDTWTIV